MVGADLTGDDDPALRPIGGSSARKIFDRFDVDGSGAIDKEEMGSMLRSLKMEVTPAELEALMRDADPDGNGVIEFEEFVAVINAQAVSNKSAGTGPSINLARVFQEAAKPINIFKADMAEVLREATHTAIGCSVTDDVPAASEASAPLDRIGRLVGSLAEEMDECLHEAHRDEMRAAATTAKLKLEATRTANMVALKNQAAELESLHLKQLEAKVAKLSEGGDVLLHEAHAQATQLTGELTELQAKHAVTNDLIKTTQKLHQDSERRAAKAEAEASSAMSEITTARNTLEEAMASLSIKAAENMVDHR